ncbi:hypothetical protein DFJ73DRAFT_845369 [Zopfochytrium polystomum]|nr:hypothetical protein DFJ73DRAFT_845369 [Zopfochytrium polystomum]
MTPPTKGEATSITYSGASRWFLSLAILVMVVSAGTVESQLIPGLGAINMPSPVDSTMCAVVPSTNKCPQSDTSVRRFYYDSSKEKCSPIMIASCGLESAPFKSIEECRRICEPDRKSKLNPDDSNGLTCGSSPCATGQVCVDEPQACFVAPVGWPFELILCFRQSLTFQKCPQFTCRSP